MGGLETAGVTNPGPVLGEAEGTQEPADEKPWYYTPEQNEKVNRGSSDPTGSKQFAGRSTLEKPVKLASMTPQFHTRNDHKPSARNPMKVFGRIARGHFSAETRMERKGGVLAEGTEKTLREIAKGLEILKRKA